MITINPKEENYKQKLVEDLISFGFSNVEYKEGQVRFSYLSRKVKFYASYFYSIPESYLEYKDGLIYFNVIDFKKYVEEFEKKKTIQKQNKKVIEFKSLMFDAKFQAMVDEIPNLEIERIKRYHKIITIDLIFYGIDLYLTFNTILTYNKLKTVDLFEEIWEVYRFNDSSWSRKLKLKIIFERLKDDSLRILGEECLNSILKWKEASDLHIKYLNICEREKTEQSKIDIKWYDSEYMKAIQDKDKAVSKFKDHLKTIL